MIEIRVYGSDRRWGRPVSIDPTPRVVLSGTRFSLHVEPGFGGSDVTAAEPDEVRIVCLAGYHAGQTVYLSASDEVEIEQS